MLMDTEKVKLIQKAQKIYGTIYPCVNKSSLEECFTVSKKGMLILWFNTEDKSTHMISEDDSVAVFDVLTADSIKKNRQNLPEE
jgi:hypothetical protein